MDQERATSQPDETTPIFSAYRRGYDPEQVDRYIGDQQRRLDDALHRASESERKLAAAVGQLRELHRRVAMLENEERSPSAPLDMLGERVQRILQEAWEGAYQLRQSAEHDVSEQRQEAESEVAQMREQARQEVTEQQEQARREVEELLESGQRRALLIRAETERRRQAYLEQVHEDREQAVGQLSYLHDQRQIALSELERLKATIESTVSEMSRSPLGAPSISGLARRRRVEPQGAEPIAQHGTERVDDRPGSDVVERPVERVPETRVPETTEGPPPRHIRRGTLPPFAQPMSLGLATPPATESVVGPYPLPEPAQDPIRAKQPPADPHDELLRERAVFRTGGLRTRAASRRDERAEALSPGEQQPSEDTSAVFDFEDD